MFFIMGLLFSLFILLENKKKLNLLEVLATTAVVGPIFITFTVFGLGYAGWLSRENIIIISIAITGLPLLSGKVRAALLSVRHISRFSFSNSLSTLSSLDIASLGVIVTVFAITAPSAFTLSPVLRDPYAAWLFYAKKIMETRTIPLFYGNAPDISWGGNYPPLMSFLATYYFMVLNSNSPEIFTHVSWIYGALTVLVVFALARELELKRWAVFSALLLTTSSIFTLELMNYGYVDVALAFYVVTAYYFLVKLMHEHTTRTVALFGLSLGAALLMKYLALIFVMAVAVYVIGVNLLKKKRLIPTKSVFLGLAIAFLIFLPWMMRNLLLLGNPVYPWFYQLLGGKGIDKYVMGIVPQPHYEINLLFIDNTFAGAANEDIGYTLLVFGILGFFLAGIKGKPKIKAFAWIMILHFSLLVLFMTETYGYERYLIQVAPVMAIVGCYLIATVFSSKSLMLKTVVIVCVVLFSLPNYVFLTYNFFQPPPYSEGPVIKNYIDKYLPMNAVVLTNEITLYFIDRKVVAVYNVPELFKTQQVEEVTAILMSYNVTHVIINWSIDYKTINQATPLFKALNNNDGNFKVLLEYGSYTVYEMRSIG